MEGRLKVYATGRWANVAVKEGQMRIQPESRRSSDASTYQPDDFVGANIVECTEQTQAPNQAIVCFTFFAADAADPTVRKLVQHLMIVDKHSAPDDNVHECRRWIEAVEQFARPVLTSPLQQPLKYLVLVNPFGGKKQGVRIFNDDVLPLFRQAGIAHRLVTTERPGHAKELARSLPDLAQYSAVVVVGGDGLGFEVLNGLRQRPDFRPDAPLPFGVVAAGTGNALHASLVEAAGLSRFKNFSQHSAFLLIEPKVLPLDLLEVQLADGQQLYSFLGVFWALMADVGLESERFRYFGSMRFTIQALIRIGALRHYNGSVSYLPQSEPLGEMPALSDKVPDNWVTIDGPFVAVDAVLLPFISFDMPLVPHARINDGLIHLVVLRSCNASRLRLLRLLTLLKTGSHLPSPTVEIFPCKAFRLSPADDWGRNSRIEIDGEPFPSAPVQGRLLPGAARVLWRPYRS